MSRPIRGHGGHLVFPIGPKKHKLGTGRLDLASYQVSSNSFRRFQRRSRKCLSQSESSAAILFFPICLKNTNVVGGFRGEVEKVSANQRIGRSSCFSDRPEKHKLGRGRLDLASCQVSLNSIRQFERRSRKCLSQSEARRPSYFSDRPEKHKLGRGR